MALGSNTDPYQRAEGRYRLMPGVIAALTGSGTPFSILTKGTTGRRHPELIDAYAKLYQNGSYVTRSYATDLARRSSVLLRKHGLHSFGSSMAAKWPPAECSLPIGHRLLRVHESSHDRFGVEHNPANGYAGRPNPVEVGMLRLGQKRAAVAPLRVNQ